MKNYIRFENIWKNVFFYSMGFDENYMLFNYMEKVRLIRRLGRIALFGTSHLRKAKPTSSSNIGEYTKFLHPLVNY